MNRRGGEGQDTMFGVILPIVLVLVFLGVLFLFVDSKRDNAGFWEEYYAIQIVKIVNFAEGNAEVTLDVSRAVGIADNAGISEDEIFKFDNEDKKVIVSLKGSSGTELSFFRDVDVVNERVELVSGGIEKDRLVFEINPRKA